jgi:hypothetical protein
MMFLLDRASKFEKLFPFYKMDINGYAKRLREAREFQAAKDSKYYLQVEMISLASLQRAFKTHSSWSDMERNSSEFVSFLKESCPYDQDEPKQKDDSLLESETIQLSVFKIRCLGLLWCEGKSAEKAFEFYDMLQDTN